jgi:hypothetical protein
LRGRIERTNLVAFASLDPKRDYRFIPFLHQPELASTLVLFSTNGEKKTDKLVASLLPFDHFAACTCSASLPRSWRPRCRLRHPNLS